MRNLFTFCLLSGFCFQLLWQDLNITGHVYLPDGSPLEGVEVQLSSSGPLQTQTTDNSGRYAFASLLAGEAYTVMPVALLTPEWTNACVTPADACLMLGTINNEVTLSPGQQLQADLNQNGLVTQADLGIINNIIMGEELPGQPVPEYVFDYLDPLTPGQLSGMEIFNFNGFDTDGIADFQALPLGDVNNACAPAQPPSPNQFGISLQASSTELLPGDQLCVDVVADEYVNLSNWQFGVNWNTNVTPTGSPIFPDNQFNGFPLFTAGTDGYNFIYYNTDSPQVESFDSGTVLATFCFETAGMGGEQVIIDLAGAAGNPEPLASGTGCEGLLGTSGPGGSGSQIIIPIVDGMTMPFTISCPDNQTIIGNDQCQGLLLSSPVSIDPEDGMYQISNDYNGGIDAGDIYLFGTTTVTYTVSDDLGETQVCSFTVTVLDISPPEVTCPEEVGPLSIGDQVPALEDLILSVTNECDPMMELSLDITELSCTDYLEDADGIQYRILSTDADGEVLNVCDGTILIDNFAAACTSLCDAYNPQLTVTYDEMFGVCVGDLIFSASSVPSVNAIVFTTSAGELSFQSTPGDLSLEIDGGTISFLPANGDTEINLGAYNGGFGTFLVEGIVDGDPDPEVTVAVINEEFGVLCSETFTYDCAPPSVRDCEDLGNDPGINLWQTDNIDRAQGGPGPLGNGDNYLRLRNDNGSANPWAINVASYGNSFLADLGECLCFSTYVRQQSGGIAQSYTPTVRLFRGDDVVTSDFFATFTASESIDFEDGWQRICMPLASCEDGLPANDDGSWTMTSSGDNCLDWNSLLGEFTGIAVLIEGSFPDISMGIDNFCFEECNISEASSCEATLTNSSNAQCCPSLSFSNNGSDQVTGVRLTLLDGVTFNADLTNHPAGYDFFDESPVTRVVAQSDLAPLGANVENLLDFCMLDVDAPAQRMVVEYLAGENLRTVLCTDTISFTCPVQNYCLDVSSDTLVCAEEGEGYRLQMNVVVPDDNYTDDVGRVKIIVPGLMEPILYDFPMPLTAGESYGIDTLLTGLPLNAGDSLKVLVSAHDGPEERLCCFADSLCVAIPACFECNGISTIFFPAEDDCCYFLSMGFPDVPPNIDSVIYDISGLSGSTDYEVSMIPVPGWEVITIIPNESYAFISDGGLVLEPAIPLLELCLPEGDPDAVIILAISVFNRATEERFCGAVGTGLFRGCEPDPCDSLSATLQRTESDTCAYDLYLNNTYAADPDLITSVTVNIISGPEPSFSGADLIPTAPGWDFATGSGGSYTLNPTDGAMPIGSGQQVFRFNVANSFSADSTYVEVAFLSGMDTLCRDTVVGICPGCITIPEEQILCDEDHYLYRFTFVNHSPYPVNAVRVLETEAPNGDALLNGQTHFLPEMVPVGGTYTGFLPVEFADDGDGEFCFDIVLRQVVDGELPINCCFATHCIELPDCSPASPERCVGRAGPPTANICPLEYLPVCGCDGNTYVNICYAEDRGVLNYTQGACPNTPPILPNFPIDGITPIDGTVVVGTPVPFPVPDDLPEWDGFILQRLRMSDNTWWQLDATRDIDGGQISLTDRVPFAGEQTYRIIGVLPNGRPYLSQEASVEVTAGRAAISLSPNPATDAVWLQSDRKGPAEVEIISAAGQRGTLQSVTFGAAPVRLELGRRSVGVHTVVVRFADGSWGSRRVVVR